MDMTTGIGLVVGTIVVLALILMGGDLRTFYDIHAVIVIGGGAFAATLIRFPLSSIMHGLPLGLKYAFTMRRMTARDLVDEVARLAEVARKAGPLGLEKEEVEDPFLGKGVRYVADGYDAAFIRDAMERERETFFMHLDEGQKIYRAIGDCAPAFGMVGTLIGMVQMFANMSDPSKLGPFMAIALLATLYGALVDMSFWPFNLGLSTELSYVAGAPIRENLHRFLLWNMATAMGWNLGRSVTTIVTLAIVGRPLLRILRRTNRRATFAPG